MTQNAEASSKFTFNHTINPPPRDTKKLTEYLKVSMKT